jgi:predicted ATPase
MPTWQGHGTVLRGWVLAQEGQVMEGVSLVQRGVAKLDALGTAFHRCHYLGILAGLYAQLRDGTAGLDTIEHAYDQARRTEEHLWLADLHRIEGELWAASGASDTEVEACFAEALALAQQQGAKSFELRAATSLARLWREQGRREEARALLAPVYGWFTEGFDTPDLRAANALLADLRE